MFIMAETENNKNETMKEILHELYITVFEYKFAVEILNEIGEDPKPFELSNYIKPIEHGADFWEVSQTLEKSIAKIQADLDVLKSQVVTKQKHKLVDYFANDEVFFDKSFLANENITNAYYEIMSEREFFCKSTNYVMSQDAQQGADGGAGDDVAETVS